jgi:hypothetical protein
MPGGDSKMRYSIDNYDKLTRGDFYHIFGVIKDRGNRRLEIMRFLAREAKEEKSAKETTKIIENIRKDKEKENVTFQDAFDHCNKLKEIGVIHQTRSEKESTESRGPKEVNKYYIAVEGIIEILAILDAGILGLDSDGAEKIKRALTEIVNEKKDIDTIFKGGIYASILDVQEQFLDAIRNIAQDYNQTQKDIINWWCEVAQSHVKYYYSWFYPRGFVDMASKAYRSMAEYAISGLNIAQNNFNAYIDMSKTYSGLVADNINEMSQLALINSSKISQPALQPSILTTGAGTTITTTTAATLLHDMEDNVKYDLSEWMKLIIDLAEIVQIALSSA